MAKKPNRDNLVAFALSDLELQTLEILSKKFNLTKSATIRKLLHKSRHFIRTQHQILQTLKEIKDESILH